MQHFLNATHPIAHVNDLKRGREGNKSRGHLIMEYVDTECVTFVEIKVLALGQVFLSWSHKLFEPVCLCLFVSFVGGLWMKMLEGRLISLKKNCFLQAKLLPSVPQIPEALWLLPSLPFQ